MFTLIQRAPLGRNPKYLFQSCLQYETLAIGRFPDSLFEVSLNDRQLVNSPAVEPRPTSAGLKRTRLLAENRRKLSINQSNKENPQFLQKPGKVCVNSSNLQGDSLDVFLSQNQIFLLPKCEETTSIVNFSSTKCLSEDTGSSSKKCAEEEPNLEKVAENLIYDLVNVFVQKTNWKLYHPNLIFEDRIRGKRTEGLLEYIKFLHMARVLAHIKFVYVRFHILNLTKHPEDGTIRVRWRIAGLGVTRLVLRYFPDQMWKRGNMDKAAPSWYDGYSTFYVGNDNMIYKHVADRRMPDQDKSPALNPVVEKLKKLKPNSPQPSPAL